MKQKIFIWSILLRVLFPGNFTQGQNHTTVISFYGDSLTIPADAASMIPLNTLTLTDSAILFFYEELDRGQYDQLVGFLTYYKKKLDLNDWLYYQLIRKTANSISPKSENYHRYTLYKWFLLGKSGYGAAVRIISNNRLLFYVQSDDNIYNIPLQTVYGKQFVCLNYHDYHFIDIEKEKAFDDNILVPGADKVFSYKLTKMPDFKKTQYMEKALAFTYHKKNYHLKVMVNPLVKDIFLNYPVTDFEAYFNIPLSKETYASIMPSLKSTVEKMDQHAGVTYLMHFTRYAFSFEKDTDNFGKEKRLAPEETLLYDKSDCEDRAGLFFYLVKEIYNLPMVTLLYPDHVTIAIQFDKPRGKTFLYKGKQYSVCEPTPQQDDLKIGQLPPSLRKMPYDIGYEYTPVKK